MSYKNHMDQPFFKEPKARRPWVIDPIIARMLDNAGVDRASIKPPALADLGRNYGAGTSYIHKGEHPLTWGTRTYDRDLAKQRMANPLCVRLQSLDAPSFEVCVSPSLENADGKNWGYQWIQLDRNIVFKAFGTESPTIEMADITLPAIIVNSLQGRCIGQIIDHPLLNDDPRRTYKVLVNQRQKNITLYLPATWKAPDWKPR